MHPSPKILLLAALTSAPFAQAQNSPEADQNNLVVNGGFESGIGAWNGALIVMPASFAFEGSYVGVIVDQGSSINGQTLNQTIPTVPGEDYSFTFSLLSGYGRVGAGLFSPGNAPVNVYFGDEYLGVVSNPSTTTWQTYQYNVIADSSSTSINFLDYDDQHWQILDGVSVVAVPEPSVTSLLALAVGTAVAPISRRRK